MSTFHINSMIANTVTQGDHAQIVNLLGDLDQQVRNHQAEVADPMELRATLAELNRELTARPLHKHRIAELLRRLAAGAGDVSAVARGVEDVQRAVDRLS